VKDGGYLAGHDYCPKVHPGVRKAVDEFSAEKNLPFDVIDTSFLMKIKKPKPGKWTEI
jgi:hypothetical protein